MPLIFLMLCILRLEMLLVGAKINNKKRLITTEIKNGDQVEILTSQNIVSLILNG